MPFLDWINKNQAKEATREVPYHLLKQESAYGDLSGVNADNFLIQGDNLLALKALIPFYAGRVKCIFIDPPYNTQSAFEHYDDKLEHSQWLSMMYPRLVLLRELLAEDGSIWVTIDDNEAHYLKVLMDEVFGRRNFVANVIWQKKYAPANDALWLSDSHDHILAFARNKAIWRPNKLPRTQEQDALYKNPDNDPRGPWMSDNYTCAKNADERPNLFYAISNPKTGEVIWPKRTRVWAFDQAAHQRHVEEDLIYWGKDGVNSTPRYKKFLSNLRSTGRVAATIWLHNEVGHNQDANREQQIFNPDEPFKTPKPEFLINRILVLATQPEDIVLDSFLGSGTTAAVAHKMGRRHIGIEMGNHAVTHCLPRLERVIDGESGGISEAVGWGGGGGFRFCTLGDPAFDTNGRISSEVRFATLAAYVWHFETGEPGNQTFDSPLLGIHNGTAYFLLYNGILGDRRPAGGNVLTHAVLEAINETYPHAGPKVVYGEATRLGASRLAADGIIFKQIPYDVKMR
jgi:adenine-specific DNA-methyltransferase